MQKEKGFHVNNDVRIAWRQMLPVSSSVPESFVLLGALCKLYVCILLGSLLSPKLHVAPPHVVNRAQVADCRLKATLHAALWPGRCCVFPSLVFMTMGLFRG